MLFTTFLTSCLLAGAAVASPLKVESASDPHVLLKRGGETIYITTCRAPPPSSPWSEMAYYANSPDGVRRDPDDRCQTYDGGITQYGGTHSCTFPSGVTFKVDFMNRADLAPNYSVVGGGWNGSKGFTCYKDDGRSYYQACSTLFYCLAN